VRWPLLAGIAILHLGLLYLLARAFAPEMVQSVQQSTISSFDVSAPQPSPPPPENEPEPDEGAQGGAGERATANEVSAPPSRLRKQTREPVPPVSSTGDATRSGAAERGDDTGATGKGAGTGSGNEGRGPGGVAVTRPVHISGAINNARDYPVPPGGRKARRGTEVIVRVIVGVDGRASQCSIYRPSPDAEADRITCQLVVERLGFRPAQDRYGNPVPAPFYWRQRWF
jgi:protein TonB